MIIRTIDLSDLAHEVRLSDPQISPDGRSVVVISSKPDYDSNRFEKEVILIDFGSGEQRVLASGNGLSHPRWSPRGDYLAILSPDENGQSQIGLITLPGADWRNISDTQRGVSTFSWRPDGAAIAFVTEGVQPEQVGKKRHNKSFEVGDNSFLADEPSLPHHVWLISLHGGEPRKLTSGTEGFCTFFGRLSWFPNGKSIAYTSQPLPDSGAIVDTSIRLLDLDSGQIRQFGPDGAVVALVSPDGRSIAYCRPRKELGFSPSGVFVAEMPEGEIRDVTTDIDRDFLAFGQGKAGMQWMPDNRSLLLFASDMTDRSIWISPLDGRPRRIDLGGVQPAEVSVGSNGEIALIGSTPDQPSELFFLPSSDALPKRITNFNAAIASLELGERSSVSWEGPDGYPGNGVVTYPPEYERGKSYPLVLDIHGGPMSASTLGFGMLHQLMAAEGWIVFSPNYRGSNNAGVKWQRAVINNAGDGPARDIMAGVKALQATTMIDSARLAVSGWSYGGFLTAWLSAHYPIWRAAVAGAAVTDWVDWYSLADINVWCGLGLGGSPWVMGNHRHYVTQSPISYAHKIETPTLILSTIGDPRVSVTQSYKLYHALKDNGTEVSFVAYPVRSHFPDDPVHERDVYHRWITWIREHLSGL